MTLVLKDRVKETTTTTGTGAVVLAGASTGYQSFSVIGDGNTTYYTITDGTSWEVGIGTYTASTTSLSRDTVLESSNNNNLVNFLAGVKDVFVTYPAEKAVTSDQINPFTDQVQINVNSSSAALEISQLGSGNALLIEDSASPDSTPLVIDQFGNLIIGATTRSTAVASKIEINSTGTEASGLAPSLNLTNWSSSSTLGGSNLSFFHYPSGTIGSITDNVSGNLLGRISFFTRQSTTLYGGSIAGRTASSLTGVDITYTAASHTFSGPVDVTDLEVTNIKAKDGTAAASIADSTGVITITTQLNVDNLNLSVNTLASTNTNGDITIAPNGTGGVYTQNSNGSALFVRNTTASSSGSSILTFQNLDGASNYRTVARASGVTDSNGGNGGFLVETAFSTALYKGLFVDKDSNVFFYDVNNNQSLKWSASNKYLGVNQTNPTSTLDVVGDARVSGAVIQGTSSGNSGKFYFLQVTTSNATPTFLTFDGGARSSSNQIVLPNSAIISFSGLVAARQKGSDGTLSAGWKVEGLLRRDANAASTTLIASTVTAIDNTPGWGLALSADTSNGALSIQATGAAATNLVWSGSVQTAQAVLA